MRGVLLPLGRVLVPVLLGFAGLAGIGCDESLGPHPGGAPPFTLYGYLNPRADTQAIRVFPVAETLDRMPAQPLDAEVRSTDLETGETHVWRDSVVQIEEGDYRHVFWSPFRASYEHTYRIEVRRSDGATSSAEVPVAPDVSSELLDPEVLPGTNIVRQGVVWREAPFIYDVKVHYYRRIVSRNQTVGRDTVTVPYDSAKVQITGGWRVVIDYWKDVPLLKAPSPHINGAPQLEGVGMSVLVASSAWSPPGGHFDPERLVMPGAFSNVRNGYGFVGGGYPAAQTWLPDERIRERLGLEMMVGAFH